MATFIGTHDNTFRSHEREVFFDVIAEDVVGFNSGNRATDKKMLLRNHGTASSASGESRVSHETTEWSYLSVVNNSYTVVKNEEILLPLQGQMIEYFDKSVLDEVKVKDIVSRNGAVCLSEYVFPKMKRTVETKTGHKTEVGLRFILKNSFDGSGSIVLYSGEIDFFCTNGRITGEYDITKRRHSRNFTVDGFMIAFEKSLERFEETCKLYQQYADSKLVNTQQVVELFDKLTGTDRSVEKKRNTLSLSDKLFNQYIDEVGERGNNVFSVMSALTHYASHDTGSFALRGNRDPARLIKRQEDVAGWLSSPAWKEFVNNHSGDTRVMVAA